MKYVLLLIPLVLFGCSSDSSSEATDFKAIDIEAEAEAIDVEYSILGSGPTLAANQIPITKSVDIIRDQSTALDTLVAYNFDTTLINNTDFNQEHLVLVSLGLRNGAAHNFEIDELIMLEGYAKMSITYIFPGAGCLGVAAPTIPRLLLEVATTSELLIQEQLIVEDCL